VDSQIGEGTKIHVVLPVTDESSNSESKQQSVLPKGKEKILFIDDEKDIVDICYQMLDKLGYDVTGVVGSVEALETFKQDSERFELVITDLSMPVMTGEQLAKEINQIRPDVPILVCTGFSDNFVHNKANSFGIRKLLMKPLAMNILAKEIREIFDEPKV